MCSGDSRLAARLVRSRLGTARKAEVSGDTHYGWCCRVLQVLKQYGLERHWREGDVPMERWEWYSLCAQKVEAARKDLWNADIERLELESYKALKDSPNTHAEAYLSSPNHCGRHLQMLARGNRLPLNSRLCSIANEPDHDACRACTVHGMHTAREDLEHFLVDCTAYTRLRADLYEFVNDQLSELEDSAPALQWFKQVNTTDMMRWQWLLGGDMHHLSEAAAKKDGRNYSEEDAALHAALNMYSVREIVNRAVQLYLMLAMRERDRVSGGLRMVLIRSAEECNGNLMVVRDDTSGRKPRPHVKSSLPIRVALLQCETGRSAERKRYSRAGAEPLALSRYISVRMEC